MHAERMGARIEGREHLRLRERGGGADARFEAIDPALRARDMLDLDLAVLEPTRCMRAMSNLSREATSAERSEGRSPVATNAISLKSRPSRAKNPCRSAIRVDSALMLRSVSTA
jgi:hypothetical protein